MFVMLVICNYPNFRSEWISGIDDRQHLSYSITRYEKSLQHIEAIESRSNWVTNATIDKCIEQQITKETEF